jgi:hypothetical protein
MSDLSITREPLTRCVAEVRRPSAHRCDRLLRGASHADPLGPDNVLVFAPGILGGTSAPNGGRLSVGAKSPLTGGIKESNSGGQAAHALARIGIAAVIVSGKPADPLARYCLVHRSRRHGDRSSASTSGPGSATTSSPTPSPPPAPRATATRPSRSVPPARWARRPPASRLRPQGLPEPLRWPWRSRLGHGQQGPEGHRGLGQGPPLHRARRQGSLPGGD